MQHMQTHARIMTRPPLSLRYTLLIQFTVIALVTYSNLLYDQVFFPPFRDSFSSKVFTYTVPASYSNYGLSSVRSRLHSHTMGANLCREESSWHGVVMLFYLSHGRLPYLRVYHTSHDAPWRPMTSNKLRLLRQLTFLRNHDPAPALPALLPGTYC